MIDGRSVAANRDIDDARAMAFADFNGAVGGTVISDDDLAGNTAFVKEARISVDTPCECLCLVEAGHDNRQLDNTHRPRGEFALAYLMQRP